MTVAKIIIVTLQASIFLTVFCLGLQATLQDTVSLFRRPRALLRALLAMNLVMPVFAAALAGGFALKPAVEVALVLLAVSPVPPILPQLQMKSGGSSSYVYGLLVAAGVLSIVFVPLSIEILGWIFSRNVHISPLAVAKVVTMTILLPLGLGILVHWRAPGFARRRGRLLVILAAVLLVVSIIPLLIGTGREMIALIGDGTLLAIITFTVVGLAAGQWMARPDPGEQTALALATASRHPGLAIVIALANFPAQKKQIAAAILLYLVVRTFVVLPYTRSRKRYEALRARSQPGDQRRVA